MYEVIVVFGKKTVRTTETDSRVNLYFVNDDKTNYKNG